MERRRASRANSLPGEEEGQGVGEGAGAGRGRKGAVAGARGAGGLSRFKSRSMYKISELSQEGGSQIRSNLSNLRWNTK